MSNKNNCRKIRKGNIYPLHEKNNGVIVVKSPKRKRKNVPVIGKVYHVFDDGKITPGRLYNVRIIEIYSYTQCKKAHRNIFDKWLEEVRSHYWLYDKSTDYFVKAYVGDDKYEYFVRTRDGGWFSFGIEGFLVGGHLDINNKGWNTIMYYFEKKMMTYTDKEIEDFINTYKIDD